MGKQLAAESITGGCGNGNYCPNSTVTRAQMAVFLLKAGNGSSYIPPTVEADTGFGDVAADYWADRLDKTTGRHRHHQRMRKRQLLSRCRCDPRPNGGLLGEGIWFAVR